MLLSKLKKPPRGLHAAASCPNAAAKSRPKQNIGKTTFVGVYFVLKVTFFFFFPPPQAFSRSQSELTGPAIFSFGLLWFFATVGIFWAEKVFISYSPGTSPCPSYVVTGGSGTFEQQTSQLSELS